MHNYLKEKAKNYIRRRLDQCCPEIRESFFRYLNLWPESKVPLEQAFDQYFLDQTFNDAMNFLDELPGKLDRYPYGKKEDYADWFDPTKD